MSLLDIKNVKQDLSLIKEVDNKDIAIIGIDAYYPNGSSYNEFWEAIANDKDSSGVFPSSRRSDAEKYLKYKNQYSKDTNYFLGSYLDEIDKFDYKYFQLTPKEANLMDPNQRLLLQSVWKAIEDAGYGGDEIYGSNTGVFVTAESRKGLSYQQLIQDVNPESVASSLPGNSVSMMPGRISYLLDLHGPAMVIDSACSSGLAAIHLSMNMLRKGEIDMAIAGGVKLNFLPLDGGLRVGIESSDGRTQAFSDDSTGTTIGEGVAAFILKPLSKALRDKDNIHAVLKGSSMKHDGRAIGVTAPDAKAQEHLLVSAWKDAGINAEDISYIETHGTGTNLGDPIEVDGISNAFQQFTNKKQFCGIGSVKSNYAHTDNLAGMTGLLKCVMSLKNKHLPSSLYFNKPNQKIDFENSPVFVNDRLNEWVADEKTRLCGVSSFGMSGTICHVVLEESPLGKIKNEQDTGDEYVFILSAKSESSVKRLVGEYVSYLENNVDISIADICFTASVGRGHYQYRLAILTNSIENLKVQLEYINSIDHISKLGGQKNGIFYSQIDKSVTRNDLKIKEEISPDLFMLARDYVNGANVDFSKLYSKKSVYKVSLPTYQFDKEKCWVDIPELSPEKDMPLSADIEEMHQEIIEFLKTQKDNEQFIKWKNILESKTFRKVKDQQEKKKYELKGRESTDDYTSVELEVAEAWYAALGIREVDINEDFFELGGDSFIAVQLISELNNKYKVALNDIFTLRTIKQLANKITQMENDNIYENLDKLVQVSNEVIHVENAHKEYLDTEKLIYMERLEEYKEKNLRQTNNYQNILLTGSTGYLGIYLLRDLLDHTNANIHLLIRGESQKHAEEKLVTNWSNYFPAKDITDLFNKSLHVIMGDLSTDRLGLDEEEYTVLANKVDCIVHSAGLVKHFGEYSTFENINVKGTNRLIDLAKFGMKKDFNLISSTAVARGKVKNREYVLFSEFDTNIGQSINNPYGVSKFEAEKIVLEARKEGVNSNLFRVGNIMFDSKTGQFQSNIESNGLYTIIRAMIKMNIFPNQKREELDFSFIDYVSKSIVLLFNRTELSNEIHHIFNQRRSSLYEISQVVKQRVEDLEVTDFNLFIQFIKDHYNNSAYSSYINHLLLHFGIFDYFESQDTTHYSIVSDKTEMLLKELGFEWKKPSEDQIHRMLNYCEQVNFI
ncbi:beta-ketoacyl synthase N-terminal-like domain-containing protein [Oceanobacillus oncorhynchi]|uniref:beta-ketoacyl synthase N-terminal-like domain-containing protein n=1 Tax=Oceanobacillus oncorhynchi TaxID=545501 RepID=UPI001868BDCB|nr:beta-ketoacyl synthase N-terminal-like domain-containing protein [Oceanobacillus oncorhynchi]